MSRTNDLPVTAGTTLYKHHQMLKGYPQALTKIRVRYARAWDAVLA
jgi:hypothetical protein